MERFRRAFDEALERFTGGVEESVEPEEAVTEPATDCFIEGGQLVIRLDLPGVDPKDVEVKASEGVLTIRAAREEKPAEQKREYVERELPYGTFERTIELPEGVNADDIRATCRDGVLELTVPIKGREEKEVKIQVEPGARPAGEPKAA